MTLNDAEGHFACDKPFKCNFSLNLQHLSVAVAEVIDSSTECQSHN